MPKRSASTGLGYGGILLLYRQHCRPGIQMPPAADEAAAAALGTGE